MSILDSPSRIVRVGPTAWVLRPRMVLSVTVAFVIAFVLFLLSITISDYPVTPADVIRILLGGGTRIENVVILDDAVPRALVSVLVGFALGLSGSLTQLIARNPLATPDMLGITAGPAWPRSRPSPSAPPGVHGWPTWVCPPPP